MDQRGGDAALVARRARLGDDRGRVDLRVGGEVRVVMRDPHEDIEYGGGGQYTEIDPPTRLAFTWIWDDDTTRQLIELDFEEADGVTTVRFTHSGLWDEEAVRSHEDGWGKAFDNLERALSRSQDLTSGRLSVISAFQSAQPRPRDHVPSSTPSSARKRSRLCPEGTSRR